MAKLGSNKKPIWGRVKTFERMEEAAAICLEHGWKFSIGIDPDKPENLTDLHEALSSLEIKPAQSFQPRYGRNDYCPCGSGKKYKKCCWDKDHPE